MNPEYVYLLWFHDEEGPEEMKATTDRGMIIPMIDAMPIKPHIGTERVKLLLSALLDKYDDEALCAKGYGVFSLERQYGGLHFQIVRVWEGLKDE